MMNKYISPLLALILLMQLFQQFPLRAWEAFNTGAFECSEGVDVLSTSVRIWRPVLVRRVQVWMGMSGGAVADFSTAVIRKRGNNYLSPRTNWDHYAEPSGINDQIVDTNLSPDFILLLPGDTLTLYYRCQRFSETGQGHVIVFVWSFP